MFPQTYWMHWRHVCMPLSSNTIIHLIYISANNPWNMMICCNKRHSEWRFLWFLWNSSTFRLMKCIDRAALNSRASPSLSPVLDLELDQALTQTAVISRVHLADITEISMSGYKIRRKIKQLGRIISFIRCRLWPFQCYKTILKVQNKETYLWCVSAG